jgi:hypothetical protein
VELTKKNKLTYTGASSWLLSKLYHDARIHERQVNMPPFYDNVDFSQHSGNKNK